MMRTKINGLPATVETPLWVYDVALAGIVSRPAQPAPVVEVTVDCRVDRHDTAARDVRVELSGPGVLTPTSATELNRIRPGDHGRVSFRWAAPLRSQPPPYELELTASVTYRTGRQHHRTTASATTRVEPPPAPTGKVYLSDLPFDFVTNGYGTVQRDRSVGGYGPDDGQPLVLGGVSYDKGIGVNTVADVGVHIGGGYRTFEAVIGVDDGAGENASVSFRVVGDGRKLFQSSVFRRSSAPKSITVDVRGVQQLDLIADDAGDGHGDDHADWADARLS